VRDYIVCSTKYLQKFGAKYTTHKALAKRRGVPFELTREQWLKVWIDSGHIFERGSLGHQYVMARLGDRGSYVLGNVKIITGAENISEAQTGRVASLEARQRQSAAKKGKTFTADHCRKLSEVHKGRVPWNSPEYVGELI
jgi:hypothetical protein